ncbi:MAG: hypothetical protein ACK4HM_09995 [Thermosynechococcus sp.]
MSPLATECTSSCSPAGHSIPSHLQKGSNTPNLIPQLVMPLVDETSLSEQAAHFAVETWAAALGIAEGIKSTQSLSLLYFFI